MFGSFSILIRGPVWRRIGALAVLAGVLGGEEVPAGETRTSDGSVTIIGVGGGTVINPPIPDVPYFFVTGTTIGQAAGSDDYQQFNKGRLVVSDEFVVGDAGRGSFSLSDGEVTVGTTWWDSYYGRGLVVGRYGQGSVYVGGGTFDTTIADVGEFAGASGAITTRSTFSADLIRIGLSGTGELNVTGGTTATVGLTIGYEATGKGSVSVAGGLLSVDRELAVGRAGEGSLTLSGSGVVDASLWYDARVILGVEAGSKGTLNIGQGGVAGTLHTREVTSGDGVGVVNFNSTGTTIFDTRLGGALSVNKLGLGTVTLTGENTYSGATKVSEGWLRVNGDHTSSTSTITVASGGALGGTGTIGGDIVVLAGGTLGPGAAVGQLTSLGDVTMSDGAMLAMILNGTSAGAFSQLSVGGKFAAKGTLFLDVKYDAAVGDTFQILTSGGYDSGSFKVKSSMDELLGWNVSALKTAGTVKVEALSLVNWEGPTGSLPPAWNVAANWAGGNVPTGATHIVLDQGVAELGGLAAGAPDNREGHYGRLFMGTTADGDSRLTLKGGAGLTGESAYLGYAAGSVAAVTLVGGTWNNSEDLVVGRKGAATLSITGGVVSNADGVIGREAGSVGAVTVNGGTWSNASSLIVGKSGTAVLTITGSPLSKGVVSVAGGSGTLMLAKEQGSSGILNILSDDSIGGGSMAGELQAAAVFGGGGKATVNFNHKGNLAVSSNLMGSLAVNVLGTGTTTFSGINSYTGSTSVRGGTLFVTGNAYAVKGNIVVDGGATLGGTAALGGNVVVQSGTLSPGVNSVGILTLPNGLTLSTESTLALDIIGTGAGMFDQIALYGSPLSLGGTLSISVGYAASEGDSFLIFPGGLWDGMWGVQDGTLAVTSNLDPALKWDTSSLVTRGILSVQSSSPEIRSLYTAGDWHNGSSWIGGVAPTSANYVVIRNRPTTLRIGTTGEYGRLAIGDVGGGSLVIAGGRLTGEMTTIGLAGYDWGDVTITSGTWTNTDSVILGKEGRATMTLTGGLVTNAHGRFAIKAGSFGIATVSGGTWNNLMDLIVGESGTGTLSIASKGVVSVGGGSGTLTLARDAGSFGTLNLSGGTLNVAEVTGGGGSAVVNINNTGPQIFSTWLTGGLALNKLGKGVLSLTGESKHTGGTTIGEGTLQIGSGSATGSIAGNILNRATLAFNRSNTLMYGGVISGTGKVVQLGKGTTILTGSNVYSGLTTVSAGTLQIGNGGTTGSVAGPIVTNATLAFNRSGTLVYGGAVSGKGNLVQRGPGVLALTGSNTYSGTTVIAGGTLQIGNGGATGSIATKTVLNNATLAFNRSGTLNFVSAISGTGRVRQVGSGTTILAAVNTYTGGTVVEAGTLQIGSDKGGSILGNVLNNATLAFGASKGTFGGLISGTGRVVQSNAKGTTILTGANTYTGGTVISAGTLQVGSGTVGSITGNVLNNGTLAFGRGNTMTFGGVVSGTGKLLQSGTGTTILTGNNTYTGVTTIAAGRLQLGNGGTTGSIAGAVVNNATLAFNRSDAVTFAGAISGKGKVVQAGSGTTILKGANSYTGGTYLEDGTLRVGSATALSKGPVVLNDGVLATDGTIHKINVAGNMTWDSDARIALTLTLTPDSEFVAVTGKLSLTGSGKWTFDLTPVGLTAGHWDFKVMTVAGGFGKLTADNFAFVSSDPGFEGIFRIAGRELWFDDGYEPAGLVATPGVAAVPEPSTYALLALGAVFALLVRYRKIARA